MWTVEGFLENSFKYLFIFSLAQSQLELNKICVVLIRLLFLHSIRASFLHVWIFLNTAEVLYLLPAIAIFLMM